MSGPAPVVTRQQILDALRGRLLEIRPPAFTTDVGQRVHLGHVTLSPDDAMPVLCLGFPEDEELLGPGDADRLFIRMPFEVDARTAADSADPLAPAEPLRADIERALFRDRDLGGLADAIGYAPRPFAMVDREAGGELIGCRVRGYVDFVTRFGGPAA